MFKRMIRLSILNSTLFICGSVFAQNYVPFPADSARWRVSYGMSIIGCTGFAGEAQYEITGDTIMASQTYHKIYQVSYSASSNCYATGGNGFICGIREDSSKHIWLRYDASLGEELLYDFSLNVGDTVNTLQNCGCDATVTSIDSVLIGTTYRKRFHVATNFFCGGGTISIIEGIGSTSNLLQCFGWLEQTSSLTCFWQNGAALYPSQAVNCAPLVQNILETGMSPLLSAYPNPANNEVVISWETTGDATFDRLTIYNHTGQVVRCESIRSDADKAVISRDGIAIGVYFVELSNRAGTVSRTLIAFQ